MLFPRGSYDGSYYQVDQNYNSRFLGSYFLQEPKKVTAQDIAEVVGGNRHYLAPKKVLGAQTQVA